MKTRWWQWLLVAPMAVCLQARAQELAGQWQGTIHPADRDQKVAVKIFKDEKGALKADLFWVDAGRPFHADSITRAGNTVTLKFDTLDLKYSGDVSADGTMMTGTWERGDRNEKQPLTLMHATKETAWEIAAPPAPPKMMDPNADASIDVATIKPASVTMNRMGGIGFQGRYFKTFAASAEDLVAFAYGVQRKQIVGQPEWMQKDRYDIEATVTPEGLPSPAQLSTIAKKLLAERFGFKFHDDTRELSAYTLTALKSGTKMKPTEMTTPNGGFGLRVKPEGTMIPVNGFTMKQFAGALQSLILDRPVVDQTGLTGRYDFNFTFSPDDSEFNGDPPKLPKGDGNVEPAPSIFEAFQQQLGLKLTPEKTQVPVMVIDHIEKPAAN